jgi:two-component system OmpR family sensor kinase
MKKLQFKINSLKKQLLLGIFSGIIILMVLLEISQYYSLKNNLNASKFQLLESRLHNINVDKLEKLGNQETLKKNAESLVDSMVDLDVGISIIDSDGNLFIDSEEKARSEYINNLLPREAENYTEYGPLPKLSSDQYKILINTKGILEKKIVVNNSSGMRYMLLICKLGELNKSSGLIQLSTSMLSVDNIIKKQLIWYIAAGIGIFAIMVIVLSRFILFSLNPLNKITSAMAKINENKLNTRIELDVNQIEINKLIEEFNGMLGRIQESFENEKAVADKMRKFVSDASHELRTPLTSIQGFSQLLSNGDIESEEDKKIALDSITDESKRLTRLLNNLLLLTRLDYKIKIHKKPENIREIIDEIYQQLKYISGLRELNVHTEDVWVNSNSDQIKQIFINLVNNASQHTDKDHGKISIVLKNAVINEIRYGVIIVSDNGIGIPEEKLSKIFDRFYRVESHRSRKNGGFGLGLSIVKSIVDENDGKIQVESQVGHGSKFTIYFKAIDVSKEILS